MQAEWDGHVNKQSPSHIIPISCLSSGWIGTTLYVFLMSSIKAPLVNSDPVSCIGQLDIKQWVPWLMYPIINAVSASYSVLAFPSWAALSSHHGSGETSMGRFTIGTPQLHLEHQITRWAPSHELHMYCTCNKGSYIHPCSISCILLQKTLLGVKAEQVLP